MTTEDSKIPDITLYFLGMAGVGVLGLIGYAAYEAAKPPEKPTRFYREPEWSREREFFPAAELARGGYFRDSKPTREITLPEIPPTRRSRLNALRGEDGEESAGAFEDEHAGKAIDLRGEWWFDDDGQAIYSDGDMGDFSHESYAGNAITRSILDVLDVDFAEKYYEEYVGELSEHEDAIRKTLGIDEDEDVEKFIRKELEKTWPDKQRVKAALDAAYGRSDARDYAVRYLGWKRVHGNYIQTWTLTSQDIDTILNAIWDASGGEELHPFKAKFSIGVDSTGQFFEKIPLAVLELKSPLKLRPYLQ